MDTNIWRNTIQVNLSTYIMHFMYSIIDTLHLNDFLAESILTRKFSFIPRIMLFTHTTFNVHHAKET